MIKIGISIIGLLIILSVLASAEESPLEQYISGFDYAQRWDMKITSPELVKLLQQDRVQFADMRLAEEYAAWQMGFGMHIPLPELTDQLGRMDSDTLAVTACPHKDRAIIAMVFLKPGGIK